MSTVQLYSSHHVLRPTLTRLALRPANIGSQIALRGLCVALGMTGVLQV